MSKKILRIFDGIDRVGKSTCIKKLGDYYEEKGLKVKIIHNKENNLSELVTKKEFNRMNALITDYNEKATLSLMNYAYFFQLLFEDYDVILVDRLYMTFKSYAEINRPGSIERVFTKQSNFYEYIRIFNKMLERIHEDIDIQQYLFTKVHNAKFEDDNLDGRFKQDAEALRDVNRQFFVEYSELSSYMTMFNANFDESGYFNTYRLFKKYQLTANQIELED